MSTARGKQQFVFFAFTFYFYKYAEVVTHVAGCHKAEGLPGCPWMLTCWNKCDETLTKSLFLLLHEL